MLAEADARWRSRRHSQHGNLGIMDYYNLKNLQSDTEMRNSIAGTSQPARMAGQTNRTEPPSGQS